MKRRPLLSAAFGGALAGAFAALPPVLRAQAAAEPKPELLVGRWGTEGTLPNGFAVRTRVGIASDGTFSGTTTTNDKPFWEYAGRWTLQGRVLTWTYEFSSRTLVEEAKVDVDEIERLDERQLVTVSRRTGRRHVLQRLG